MRNCFPALPRPANGGCRGPVEDEYEEMSMDEIMNGKVRSGDFKAIFIATHVIFTSALLGVRGISGPIGPRGCLRRHSGC